MKVLHVYPQFTPESVNGSERYEYLLSKALVELGVEVELLTTTTRDFLPVGAFCLHWPHQYTQEPAQRDGISIVRQRATFHLPAKVGHFVSRRIENRWKREEQLYGAMLKGSRAYVDYFHRRAAQRPLIYDVIATLGRGPFSLGMLRQMASAICRCDLVQAGFTPFATCWQAVAMARLMRKPVVVLALFHPEDLSHHFRTIYWSFSAADAVLMQTPYSARILKRMLPASNPVTIGAGVDLAQFADSRVCGARFRAKFGLQGKKLALFVGRKELFKRYDVAIEAVESIPDDNLRLVMIGRDIDRRSVSSGRAVYLGELPSEDVADAYDACDVFVMPSENESFGIVFLEAWARRKPVIGNRLCAPVASVIEHGRDGFLCAGAAETAAAISKLIADPALARAMGAAGFEKTIKNYSWDVIAGKVNGLYSNLAEKYKFGRH
jgi:glycosyltransferase involved in cell wall biosynthesis